MKILKNKTRDNMIRIYISFLINLQFIKYHITINPMIKLLESQCRYIMTLGALVK